ncbi:hypothetical protein T01_1309 [Trichinella spiralis]|uniref:Uncharacterized protein n=1 Tax=Trichinella spiralis TaxID=6334 RepID=A0A0V0YYP4_TRISP|nr:hypothetical protein T01_1309 [Trichinella spiralis]
MIRQSTSPVVTALQSNHIGHKESPDTTHNRSRDV